MKLCYVWTLLAGLLFQRIHCAPIPNMTDIGQVCHINETLRITVALDEPYAKLKDDADSFTGNERYEGYCIDLLSEIANLCKFNYVITPVKDGKYGGLVANGSWNGMIGELQRNEADLCMAGITITVARSEVVDFTVPFMHLGIAVVTLKPAEEKSHLLNFLDPLTGEVWACVILVYVVLSIIVFLMTQYVPKDRDNSLNLLDSMWFMAASLLGQGTSFDVFIICARAVTVIWWFFTFIIMSSYTANLAAFLTVHRLEAPLDGVEALAKQTKVAYGVLASSSTATFFEESEIPIYKRLWLHMNTTEPSVFVDSEKTGIERVKKGNYALFSETPSLEYYVEQDCSLMIIGQQLDDYKTYGIGVQKGSPYIDPLSLAILELQDRQILVDLKRKWWKEKSKKIVECDNVETNDLTSAMTLENLAGIFLVLAAGLGFAIILTVCEKLLVLYRARTVVVRL